MEGSQGDECFLSYGMLLLSALKKRAYAYSYSHYKTFFTQRALYQKAATGQNRGQLVH